MYDGSEQLREAVAQASRHISVRIKINGSWYTTIKSLTLNSGSSDIVPGAALSSYIEVQMVTDEVFGGMPIEVEIGVRLADASVEYVPMGIFIAQKPEEESGLTKFKAYDKMSRMEYTFTSTLTYPAKAEAVLMEACEQCGVEFDGTVDDVDIPTSPTGYTCREVVGFIAGLCGKFAYIGRDGKLRFKWYENMDCDLLISRTFSYSKGESDTHIEYVKCNVDKEISYQSGAGSSGITFDCPYMTQEQLDVIYERMKDFKYRSGNINFHGNPFLDIGDVVTTNDLQKSYSMPVMKLVQTYTGGLSTTIEASGSTSSEGDFKGPTTKSLERVYEEFLLVNEIVGNKLSVKEADILYLRADKQSVIEADIYNAVIAQADIRYAKISEFDAYEGRVSKLETEALTSDSAIIQELTSKVNKTDVLIFGAAGGTTIQTEFSNSVIASLGEAQIKSAMIEEIAASKITGLDLNTTKFTVHSDDGKSVWADNTIQIYDGTRVRVQIGKDAEEDYNMYLWDKSGNLLFDAIGLTEQGISRKIIRDDVVKDDANISAGKLNIDSLFNVINNDGTHTLKSTKIYLNEQAQSLDVAFNAITTTMDNLQTTQSSQGTQISTIQGQISSKIWQEDITNAVNNVEESITTLSTQYSTLNQTVNGIQTTVGSHTTSLNGLETRVENAESNIDVNAQAITTKVSYNGVISAINQSAEEVKIQASKIALEGAVTISALDNSLKNTIENTSDTAATALTTATTVQNKVDSWSSTGNTTLIDGAKIYTGSITANAIAANSITGDKLNMNEIFSRSITAYDMNIVGGKININTSSEDESIIKLNAHEGKMTATYSAGAAIFWGELLETECQISRLSIIFKFGDEAKAVLGSTGLELYKMGDLTISEKLGFDDILYLHALKEGKELEANYLTVNAQDSVHEGGEISLAGAGTHTNITLDNYYGDFRIFDTTGQPLRIDCTAKTITGGYSFDGSLNGTFTTSGLSLVSSGRCYIKSGGYYQSGNMVFIQMAIHINVALGERDYWNLYSGFPIPRNSYAALAVSKTGTLSGALTASIESNVLKIVNDYAISAGTDICVTGIYLT